MIYALEQTRASSPRYARAILAIARSTWLEASRSRWGVILLVCLALLASVAQFVGAWALVEREQVVLSIVAPLARILAMLVVSLFAVSTVVREFNERSILQTLAAPLSRASWMLGKGLGLSSIALTAAAALSAPILLLAPMSGALPWAISLAFELVVLSFAALLLACVLRQIPAAVLGISAFYLMSRLIGVLVLVAERAPYESSAAVNRFSQFFLTTLATLLPRFDLFTQSAWLFERTPISVLGPVLAQSLLYCTLLWLVACLDFAKAEL